jgi:hypothetical protein
VLSIDGGNIIKLDLKSNGREGEVDFGDES